MPAGGLVTAAIPLIGSAVGGLLGMSGAGRAGKALANANIAAEHGSLAATQDAKDRIDRTLTDASTNVGSANQVAQDKVNQETERGNSTLQRGFDAQSANLNPYLAGGQTGINSLAQYASTRPAFSFNPSDLQNDPGYQFQLQQGTAATNNSAAARGLLSSGNTLQDLTKFGQGLAGTYYNDAFQRAKSTFDTNQNSTLANLSTLAGIGLNANSQFGQASENNSNQQAGNTIKAGYFGGTSDQDIAKYLSSLDLAGNTTAGQFGLQGAKTAGDYAVGAAGGTAAGIQGGTNSLLGGIKGVTNSLPAFLKKRGGGGGGNGDFGGEVT